MNIIDDLKVTYLCSCCRDVENVSISTVNSELNIDNMHKYMLGSYKCSNCLGHLTVLSAKFKFKKCKSENN